VCSRVKILLTAIVLGLVGFLQAQSIVIPPDKMLHVWAGYTVASSTYYMCKTYIIPNDEKKTFIATLTMSSLVALGKEIYDYGTNPAWTINDSTGDFIATMLGAGFTIIVIKWEF